MVDQKMSLEDLINAYMLQKEFFMNRLREQSSQTNGNTYPSAFSIEQYFRNRAPGLFDMFNQVDKDNRRPLKRMDVPPFPYQGLL